MAPARQVVVACEKCAIAVAVSPQQQQPRRRLACVCGPLHHHCTLKPRRRCEPLQQQPHLDRLDGVLYLEKTPLRTECVDTPVILAAREEHFVRPRPCDLR